MLLGLVRAGRVRLQKTRNHDDSAWGTILAILFVILTVAGFAYALVKTLHRISGPGSPPHLHRPVAIGSKTHVMGRA